MRKPKVVGWRQLTGESSSAMGLLVMVWELAHTRTSATSDKITVLLRKLPEPVLAKSSANPVESISGFSPIAWLHLPRR